MTHRHVHSAHPQARVVFYNNTGPFGSAHLLEVGDPKLIELALNVPFQTEVRATLLREGAAARR